ncbi:MAG: flagellar hook-length control protein FliK [Salinarimonadaceae bacterium]|nr:MAG: flagellar hook-length control protein FliK [Salinarimonadaceae bacterium]
MRTEIADFLPAGMKAPPRAAAHPAAEPRERFALPPEPADRRDARSMPASRPEAPPARGREARNANGVDPATVASARALERAAPQSALRRGDESAPSVGAIPDPESNAPADTAPADLALIDADAPAATAAAVTAPLPQEDEDDLGTAPGEDPDALVAVGEDGADDALAQLAARIAALHEGDQSEAEADAEIDAAANAEKEAAPSVRPENNAAAHAASVRDLARERPVDGQAVAEAARAMRGQAMSQPLSQPLSMQGVAAEAEPGDEAGADADSTVETDGKAPPSASTDASRTAPVDLDAARARALATVGQNGGQAFGLTGTAPGAENAAQAAGQAGAVQSAALQSAALQAAALQSEAARAAAAQQPTIIVPQTAFAAVPMTLGLKALNGVSNFQIRLDPAELGRIDVSLKIDGEGNVNAKLVVDRVETLQLLQRDARTLERAFEQAGLKPSEGGVDLSLRDSGAGDRQNGREAFDERRGDTYGRPGASGDEAGGLDPRGPEALIAQAALRRALGGVDLRI